MKRKIVFIVSACLIIFSSTITLQANEPSIQKEENKLLKILTIGNSFADNACTYLRQIAESIPGYKIEITKANIGGCSLEKHADFITKCEDTPGLKSYSKKYCLKELLQMDNYDFVTIQQVSSSSWRSETFQPHADILIKFIRKHSPGSEIVIHQTWAYHPNCIRFKKWGISSSEMHKKLVKNYDNLAEEYSLNILPSGEAFYMVYEKNPDLNLWKEDTYHANVNGSYLAGCVWFSCLFHVSPKQIDFVPEEMDEMTAKFIRRMAKKAIRAKSFEFGM
jgi:hypothetical protein